MSRKFFILLFICWSSLEVFGQSLDDIQTPKLIPPSPDAAALGKYGQIPVDKSTGIPQISIPLYEIKTPRFSLPISLSYHASGIKVEEISSWVGAGWVLNAGGVITRTIVGLPDDGGLGILNYPVKNASDVQFPRDWSFFGNVLNRLQDTEPDNFFYNFNGHSGAFVFGQDNNPVLIPYAPVRIHFSTSHGFDVTDEQGNKYSFNTTESESSNIPDMSAISSWYLTQMVSADLSDTLKFVYSTDSSEQVSLNYNFSQDIGPTYDPSTRGLNLNTILQQIVSTISEREYTQVRIHSILFKGGKVDFIGKGGRLDEGKVSLDSVIVYNYNGSTNQYNRLRSFKLLQDYFYSTYAVPSTIYEEVDEMDKHRLKLTGLVELDKNDDSIKATHFDYNTTILPQVHSYAQDNWGYFNGQTQNPTLLQGQYVNSGLGLPGAQPVYFIGGDSAADRSLSSTNMQAGVLQKITYPTGGYTTFSYECNQQVGIDLKDTTYQSAAISFFRAADTTYFTPSDSSALTGGAGIFHIQISPHSANPGYAPAYVKIVNSSDGSLLDSIGADLNNRMDTLLAFTLTGGVTYELISVAPGPNTRDTIADATITTTYKVPSGSNIINVGGLRVHSIQNYNSDGSQISAETYSYGVDGSGAGNPLSFSITAPPVTQYNHPSTFVDVNNHFGVDEFTFVNNTLIVYSNNSVYPMSTLNGSPVGYPVVTVYHGDALHNIGKTVYGYTITHDSLLIRDDTYWQGIRPVPVTWKNGDPDYEYNYRNNGSGSYTLVQAKSNSYQLIDKKDAVGLIVGYRSDPMGYSYNNPDSDGTLGVVTPFIDGSHKPWDVSEFYWFDYPISTGIRVLTGTSVTNYDTSGVLALTENTIYFYDDTTLYMPTRTIRVDSKGDSVIEYSYRPLQKAFIDSINTLSDTAATAIDSMVARNIITPTIEQVQYRHNHFTELSLNNYKNWDSKVVAPQYIQTRVGAGPLENRLQFNRYDSLGNPLELQRSDDVRQVYLWGYNGQYPVARILNTTYDIAKTYITQSILTNPSSDVALRTQLNNLRSIPHAQATIYTYQPLVGMTSQTDIAGRKTYYEYDGLQRLHLIRDQDSNIIKTLDYQYQFTNSCGSNCFIEPMQTLAGTNTLGYPVGVFNVHGNLLGNVSSQSAYITLWNADTADSHTGTLAAGADSLHFHITLNTGKSLPSITGCRYYQVDLHWNKFDGVRNLNGAYVDFGDTTGMHLGKTLSDTPSVIASRTTYATVFGFDRGVNETYFVHTYPDTSKKTVTLYHNDANESEDFDNLGSSPTGLKTLTNLRGNLPQNTDYIGGSSYQQPGMTSIDSIYNWSSIHNIHGFRLNDGDGVDPCQHIHYPQDFLAGNQDLDTIFTAPSYYANGVRDTSFKISRLKSNWNTYFTHLRYLDISDRDWNREDLSALKELVVVQVTASTSDDLDDTGSALVTIPSSEIDAILNQVAAGAGGQVYNGFIFIDAGGPLKTSASDASIRLLKEKGWQIQVNRVAQ